VIKPFLVGMKLLKSFSVYSRWGTLVFHSIHPAEWWDGRYRGQEQPAGVYVWILVFINNNNQEITEKGTITLIR